MTPLDDRLPAHPTPCLRASFPTTATALLILLTILAAYPTIAQWRQYKFGRLTDEQGLSHFRTYDLVQDRQGFLWIATLSGLDRYDGYGIRNFRHKQEDTSSLSDDIITALLLDHTGRIWAGTHEGSINRFDAVTETFARFVNDPDDSGSVNGSPISTMYEDRSGTIWIGTSDGGLSKMTVSETGIAFIHFRHTPGSPGSLNGNRVFCILEDSRGTLWVGTEKGLDTLDRTSGRFSHFSSPSSGPEGPVTTIFEDGVGNLWVGTEGAGLYQWEKNKARWRHYRSAQAGRQSLSNDFVTSLLEDGPRFLWVGTRSGLNKLDRVTGNIDQYHHSPEDPSGLVYDYIIKLRRDRSGILWIVTDRGLNMLTPRTNQFAHYMLKSGKTEDQTITALWEDRWNNLWIGNNGLRIIGAQTGKIARFTTDRLGEVYVQAFHEDPEGNLWIGTLGDGLFRFDARSRRFSHYDWASSIMSITVDNDGVVWAGAYENGLFRYDQTGKTLTHFLHDPSDSTTLSSNNVFAVMHDHAGALWVGTEGGGINRLERASSTFTRFTHSAADSGSLSNDRIYAIYEDRTRRLWIATGNGLNEFDQTSGTFRNLFAGSNLASSQLTSIGEDHRGHLWIGTMQQGLIRVDPERGTLTSFDAQNGLPGNSFPYAHCRRKNGMLLFGGNHGFVAFHPDSVRESMLPPTVVLTAFRIFDRPAQMDTAITEARTVQLAHDENYFSFEFAALDFSAPGRNQYRYILESFDKEWTTTARRFANYTNVDPGDYTLRVVGSNSDGVWNEAGRVLFISIAPPYWATWWFRGLVLAIVIGILAGAYHYRVSKLLEMERMRLRIASDLHDDIGSNLGSIALLSDLIRNSGSFPAKQTQLLHEISRSARLTADALRDIVWVINPAYDKLDNMVLRMKDAAASMLRNIDHSFHCSDHIMAGVLDMEFRRNILLIYKEILHNILKHARATRVDIRIEENNGGLVLTIADNGVGFDPSLSFTGNGLRNLKSRATKIGGHLDIRSLEGKGASFILSAKIP